MFQELRKYTQRKNVLRIKLPGRSLALWPGRLPTRRTCRDGAKRMASSDPTFLLRDAPHWQNPAGIYHAGGPRMQKMDRGKSASQGTKKCRGRGVQMGVGELHSPAK